VNIKACFGGVGRIRGTGQAGGSAHPEHAGGQDGGQVVESGVGGQIGLIAVGH